MRWMDEALARDAKNTPAAVARARLLVAQGHTERALSAVDVLVADTPEMPAALKLRAELLGVSGRYAESVSAYDRYLAVAPADLAARRQQARIEGWRGAYRGLARSNTRELREEQPQRRSDCGGVGGKTGVLQRAMGRGGGKRYDQWLALDPNDVEAQLERAQLSDRLGPPAGCGGRLSRGIHVRDAQRCRALRGRAHRLAPAAERGPLRHAELGRRRRTSATPGPDGQRRGRVRRPRARLWQRARGCSAGRRSPRESRIAGTAATSAAQMSTALASSMRASGTLAYRKLDAIDGAWFGDARRHVALRARACEPPVRVERSLILENQSTLTAGLRWDRSDRPRYAGLRASTFSLSANGSQFVSERRQSASDPAAVGLSAGVARNQRTTTRRHRR